MRTPLRSNIAKASCSIWQHYSWCDTSIDAELKATVTTLVLPKFMHACGCGNLHAKTVHVRKGFAALPKGERNLLLQKSCDVRTSSLPVAFYQSIFQGAVLAHYRRGGWRFSATAIAFDVGFGFPIDSHKLLKDVLSTQASVLSKLLLDKTELKGDPNRQYINSMHTYAWYGKQSFVGTEGAYPYLLLDNEVIRRSAFVHGSKNIFAYESRIVSRKACRTKLEVGMFATPRRALIKS